MSERPSVRTYDTFEDLGRAVMAVNPALSDTADPRRVGMRFYEKYPGKAQVAEAEAGSMVTARLTGRPGAGRAWERPTVGERMQGASWQVPDPVPPLLSGLNRTQPLQDGFASGITGGATKAIGRAMGQPPPEGSLLYDAGEFVGELVGPYSYARAILGPLRAAGVASAHPQIAQTVLGGLEGAMVEGSMAMISGDVGEAIDRGATAFVLGTAGEGAVRGALGGLRAGAQYLVRPSPGEVDSKLVEFMQRWELPTVPALVRPFSNLTRQVQRRLSHTATTAAQFQAARKQFMVGMGNFRNDVVARMGTNAALNPLGREGVGHAVATAMDEAALALKKTRSAAYEEILATGVGREPISGVVKFTRQIFPEGGDPVTVETNLLDGLRHTLGENTLNEKPGLLEPVPRKLRNIYESIVSAHRSAARSVMEETPYPTSPKRSPLSVGVPGNHPMEYTVPGVELGTPPTGLGRGVAVESEGIPEHSYSWWWNKNKLVGAMFDRQDVRENENLHRMVSRFYHVLQDGIDAQVAPRRTDYEAAIGMARALHTNYMEFIGNRTVRQVGDLVRKGDAQYVAKRTLDSPDDIRAMKRLLGPQAFNSLRQGWIRDWLDDVVKRDAQTAERYLNAGGFLEHLDKRGGLDGEYFGELFSDRGFIDLATGKPLQVTTHGPEKLEQLRELVGISEQLAPAQAALKASSEEMGSGSMIERVSPGTIVSGGKWYQLSELKALLAHIYLLRKGAELYLSEPGKNPFLGASLPELGLIDIPIPFTRLSIPRTEVQNAVAVRLMGSQSE